MGGTIVGNAGEVSSLRRRMIDDMCLAGLSEVTQEAYIRSVRILQTHTGCRPDHLLESDLRRYLLYLRDEKKVAKGSFLATYYGLKFFFYRTLDRDWSLFTKKKFASPIRSESRWLSQQRTVAA